MSDRQVVDNKPSLRTLAYVLRNPELWPEGFVWDYKFCETCALGMIFKLWGVAPHSGWLKDEFGLELPAAEHIFTNPALAIHRERGGWVHPEDVADLIDAHLAARQ